MRARHRACSQRSSSANVAFSTSPGTAAVYNLTNTHYARKVDGALQRGVHTNQEPNRGPQITRIQMQPRWDILPGNVSEPITLKIALGGLEAMREYRRPTVVLDAGMALQASVAWLKVQGDDWICVRCGRRNWNPART